MPEPLFERLYRETRTMNWQPPEAIRRRGQRRTAIRRTAVLGCSFVAVALIAVGATQHVQRPTMTPGHPGAPDLPSPTPTSHPKSIATTFDPPSSIPTATRLAADLMLESAEVPGVFTGTTTRRVATTGRWSRCWAAAVRVHPCSS
jgi:hypothetical protein